MLFQKIIESVTDKVDLDYSYKELQDHFIGLLIPTYGDDSKDDKILNIAYNFLKEHRVKKGKYFTPWYDNFKQRGVEIIVTRMKPYLKSGDRLFYYYLLPNTIHTNELAFFCNEAEKYFREKGVIKIRSALSSWFNPSYKIPGRDFMSFEMIKNFNPMDKYELKSDKAKDLFKDILSEEDISFKEMFYRLVLHVPAGNKNISKKYATQIQEFLKDSEVKVITAKIKTLLPGEQDHEHYFILFPKGYTNEQINDVCNALQLYFIYLGHTNGKEAKDWFPPSGVFTGIKLREYFKDFTEFDPMSDYKMSSTKAKETFKDILENTENKKPYTSDELKEFDKHSLYSNRKDANFVYDFLLRNPKFKNDFKIVVRKAKTMPSGFPLVPDDMYFILARKSPTNYNQTRVTFCFALDKVHEEKEGVPFFYDYRYVKFSDASSITKIGRIEDYDPLDRYQVKQKTKDLFGDILRESLSNTNNVRLSKKDLVNTTSAFISWGDKSKYPKWFYDFIKNVDVSRYNLDFKTFEEAGVKLAYQPEGSWAVLIIPDKVFDDAVAKSVFDIELDKYLKRQGLEEQDREDLVKNLYMPTDPKSGLYLYHPLMNYNMKSDKAKETFKDII